MFVEARDPDGAAQGRSRCARSARGGDGSPRWRAVLPLLWCIHAAGADAQSPGLLLPLVRAARTRSPARRGDPMRFLGRIVCFIVGRHKWGRRPGSLFMLCGRCGKPPYISEVR